MPKAKPPGTGDKSKLPGLIKGGSVHTDRDYSLKTRRSKILVPSLLLMPYVALSIYFFSVNLAILGIILLSIPPIIVLIFWVISRIEA